MPVTAEQKQILRSTAPMFKEHGKEITSILYKHMIAAHPELLEIFNRTNQKNGTQPFALANTMYLAIENIDDLGVLAPQFLLISHKHRALSVLPKHYVIFEKYLLLAIDEFLGGTGDPDMLNAWAAVYRLIAGIFIETEKKLYAELGGKQEQGYLAFTLVKKETIANGPIVALTLERSDGKDLHHYHPGQYITLQIKKNGHFHNRHYSLTQPFDGKSYRIAIKQEIDHEPKGVVSNEIINIYKEGDIISLSLPAGSYTLIDDAKHHLFIAGGIGITAFTAMILDLHQQNKSDMATLIHCVPTEGHAAFADEMREILPENQHHLLVQGQHLLQGLIEQNLTPETHVYLCGSVPFMNKVEDYLTEFKHPTSQLHIDAYQPSLSLLKNAVKNQSNTKSL